MCLGSVKLEHPTDPETQPWADNIGLVVLNDLEVLLLLPHLLLQCHLLSGSKTVSECLLLRNMLSGRRPELLDLLKNWTHLTLKYLDDPLCDITKGKFL